MDDKERQCMDECLNQEVEKVQLRYLGYIVMLAFVVTSVALYVSPQFFIAVDDKDGLYRYICISLPKALMAMAVLFGSSVLADFIVPGKLLKKITENSIASAIYAGLLVLGVAIAM